MLAVSCGWRKSGLWGRIKGKGGLGEQGGRLLGIEGQRQNQNLRMRDI